ncbi:MAG: [FeFe] hydrogenase H-cluster radical SAM maturase HydG [Candidatus Omnitrophota bacterium]|nr:[FeFe] hydrogenase H-cluster radical SAM maturase HydG [Candidatus Omnitrophota bacterium]
MPQNIINEDKIFSILRKTENTSQEDITSILDKAKNKKGLSLEEVGCLLNLNHSGFKEELFGIASLVKDQIYGERIVFFAPLYISDFCVNDCRYCNFHTSNKGLARKKLSSFEIKEQVETLINMGHKRLLIEFGEDPENNNIDYVRQTINEIYAVQTAKGNIRRINVNIAATSVENYRKLKEAKIGTYQLFQETYHRKTYESLHRGPKADYERQLSAHIRAFYAGIDDVGLGVLFGLYDWRFEVLALISHAQYLDKHYKIGPHTISMPRFQPAESVDFTSPYIVNDDDFLKIIAILRIAVPYAGLILSTRERPRIRKAAFKIGISQASAGSCTSTGGYGKNINQPQFKVRDERSLDEVIKDVMEDGFLPSFCTACYRKNRTGEAFMRISKPGEIHNFCRPNGLLTFAEYLEYFTNNGLREKGERLIRFYLEKIEDTNLREETRIRLEQIRQGRKDLYF